MTILDIILTLVLIALIVFIVVNLANRRRRRPRDSVSLYTMALNHMLHGEDDTAIRLFRDVIRRDTDNIDAYINLGILMRKKDKTANAIKIHQGLLYRQEVNAIQRLEILRNLVEDYIKAGDKIRALTYVESIINIDKKNIWALEKNHLLNRDLGRWEKASEYLEKLLAIKKEHNDRLLALYKVQEGLVQYKAGEYHEARLIFRKALRIDPLCEAAYYYIGNSYVLDHRESDAVEEWIKFADVAPQKAHLIFKSLQTILYNLGNFGNIESFYENLLKRLPGDPMTLIALAGLYEKKGNANRAINILEDLVEKNPNLAVAKIGLVKILIGQTRLTQATNILSEIIEQMVDTEEYVCANCNNQSREIQWLCPVCGMADTYFTKA
ncbi:MAG: tetratricopeptide repeat protein [Candidatus Neomarinimicrobiota bacterium]